MLRHRWQGPEDGSESQNDVSDPDEFRRHDPFLAHVYPEEHQGVIDNDDRHEAGDKRTEEVSTGKKDTHGCSEDHEEQASPGHRVSHLDLGLELLALRLPVVVILERRSDEVPPDQPWPT